MNVIIDTGCANLLSLKCAIERLGYQVEVSADPQLINQADKVFLPGVGTAKHAMQSIQDSGLEQTIKALTQPVLGICLGMQLLCDNSNEGLDGQSIDCLGLIPTGITLLKAPDQQPLRLPHMGWNNQIDLAPHPIFAGINPADYFYYVHSYGAPINDYTIGQCRYNTYVNALVDLQGDLQGDQQNDQQGQGMVFSAALAKDNFIGVQFHPERSGPVGSRLLNNFLTLKAL